MEREKLWILRPLAWAATIIMMLALQFAAELICKLGEYLVYQLSSFSTIVIILIVMAFGSLFLSLFFYSAVILPSLAVNIADKIYPSNHAFRYYFVGFYEIAGCAFLVWAALAGAVSGGSMFWFYARYGWLILASIIMIVSGKNTAADRHRNKMVNIDRVTLDYVSSDVIIEEPHFESSILVSHNRDQDGDLILKMGDGSEYCYYDVPEAIYSGMMHSGNPAEFIRKYISRKYICEKIS